MKNRSYTNYRKSYRGLEENVSEPQIEEAATEIQEEPTSVIKEVLEEKIVPGVVGNCVSVNVRSEPSPNSTILDVLVVGAKVSILLSKSTEMFYFVSYGDPTKVQTGYINKDFVIRGQGDE